jgi:predicted alpha/beta superfamily hydrolase
MRSFVSASIAFTLGVISIISHAEELSPVTYPLSEVRAIHAKSNGKDYELYIQLPQSYKKSKKSYPLIVVNDSRFAFPLTSGAMQLMGDRVVQEAIVVGISDPLREYRTP